MNPGLSIYPFYTSLHSSIAKHTYQSCYFMEEELYRLRACDCRNISSPGAIRDDEGKGLR